MPKAIYGKKVRMTRMFDADGQVIPVTAVQAGPCPVVQEKTAEKEGYRAIQVGYEPRSRKGVNRPMDGHFKRAGVQATHYLKEIRLKEDEEFKVGDILDVGQFEEGDSVDVTGVSKGKGFAGGVKRHGWGGGRATHGSMFHRAPGSIGQSSYPSRVIKGKTLPGRMGDERVTVQGLRVMKVDAENHIIYLKGSIPGANGGLVMVRESVKSKKK